MDRTGLGTQAEPPDTLARSDRIHLLCNRSRTSVASPQVAGAVVHARKMNIGVRSNLNAASPGGPIIQGQTLCSYYSYHLSMIEGNARRPSQ
jgi:hypothetical protein